MPLPASSKEELEAARKRLSVLTEDESQDADTPSEPRETVQAQTLIEKAERLVENANAEDKEDLVDLVESVRDALANGDAEVVKQAVAELSDLIYYLES